ncbi:hypothetical protein JOQ06_011549 [Pogonophryne albipinna]|uniref:Fringe-like glycosyltransferase domain-containing protein n=1 Tax=Pogonophryne albipinna TaxID=1090488 RepID=A0AAD6BF45_9TELE|nr:hypothetical protein JOQ06_011549 [Pogonophryne albipinna]
MQKKRWIRRKLPICICTFFIILYVDFQLRSSSLPKLSVAHPLVPGPLQRSIQEAPSPARDAQIPGGNSSDSRAEDGGHSDSEDAHVTLPELKLEDIFIAVKTTGRFHETRLALLLETWISRTKAHISSRAVMFWGCRWATRTFNSLQRFPMGLRSGDWLGHSRTLKCFLRSHSFVARATFIFTDTEDEDLHSEGYNMVVTACLSDHSQQALSCKMSAEYDGFMASEKRWFCHVDDDNYVNPEALLSLLSVFPQDGDIYVGKPSLDKPITAHELLEGNATREVRFWFATGGAGFCLSRRLAEKMAPWAG